MSAPLGGSIPGGLFSLQNIAFMGPVVVRGSGPALVLRTGNGWYILFMDKHGPSSELMLLDILHYYHDHEIAQVVSPGIIFLGVSEKNTGGRRGEEGGGPTN